MFYKGLFLTFKYLFNMNQKKKKYIESKAFVTSAKMRNVRCKKTKKQIKTLGQNHLGNSKSIMKD